MEIIRVSTPKIYRDGMCSTPENFADYEINELKKSNVTHIWYWYTTGSYEGAGRAVILLKNGKWKLLNLGHCSCYGPLEHMYTAIEHNSPKDFKMTDEEKSLCNSVLKVAISYYKSIEE
jgi:hypothetical protein